MLRDWIMNILTTVPFYGNVVKLLYKAKPINSTFLETRFTAMHVDFGNHVESKPVLFTPSDIQAFTERCEKYDLSGFLPAVGKFTVGEFLQKSTANRAKKTYNKLIIGGLHIDSCEFYDIKPVAITECQYKSACERYEKTKARLNIPITFKQKVAIFLNKWLIGGPEIEVFEQ